MRFVILVLSSLLFLSGCGEPPLTEGDVTAKTFIAAHDEQRSDDVYETHYNYRYRYTADGYKFAYGWDYEYDHTDYWTERVPDCWQLTFTDGKRTNSKCVPEWEYKEKAIGSHYSGSEE